MTVGYARYSTQKQDGGVTIEAQDKFMRRLCQDKVWAYLKTYTDEGVSGGVPAGERPGLQELLDDAKSGRFCRVMTYDASRLARDQNIFWNVVQELKDANVIFVTVVMPEIDSTKPEFEIVAGSLQGVASYERLMVKRKTKDAMDLLKEKGKARGRPRYGFVIDEQGYFRPDGVGVQALKLVDENPEAKPKQLMEALGLDYYDAWTLLKNSKKYRTETSSSL